VLRCFCAILKEPIWQKSPNMQPIWTHNIASKGPTRAKSSQHLKRPGHIALLLVRRTVNVIGRKIHHNKTRI
jgi:hypothetical protein